LRGEVDEVVSAPAKNLCAIGRWYEDFRQVPDEAVARILEASRSAS
jgi:predicted phosphoribosyltransferase